MGVLCMKEANVAGADFGIDSGAAFKRTIGSSENDGRNTSRVKVLHILNLLLQHVPSIRSNEIMTSNMTKHWVHL